MRSARSSPKSCGASTSSFAGACSRAKPPRCVSARAPYPGHRDGDADLRRCPGRRGACARRRVRRGGPARVSEPGVDHRGDPWGTQPRRTRAHPRRARLAAVHHRDRPRIVRLRAGGAARGRIERAGAATRDGRGGGAPARSHARERRGVRGRRVEVQPAGAHGARQVLERPRRRRRDAPPLCRGAGLRAQHGRGDTRRR